MEESATSFVSSPLNELAARPSAFRLLAKYACDPSIPPEHEAVHVLHLHRNLKSDTGRCRSLNFCGDKRAHIESEFEKLKILLWCSIGFSEWLEKRDIKFN